MKNRLSSRLRLTLSGVTLLTLLLMCVLVFAGMYFQTTADNRESHRVTAGGQEIALTHMEFELLAFLMAHAGKAVTREVLLDDVWGIAYSGDTRTIDVHVRTLRQKLGDSGRMIATIRNVGYRMDEHPEAGES